MMKIFKSIALALVATCLSASTYAEKLNGMVYVSNQTENFDQSNSVREFIVKETAYCAFLVTGFSTNASGFVDLTADIRFIDSEGKVLFQQKDYAKAQSQVVPDQKTLMLDNSFDIGFTKEDPLGMYMVEASIRDNVGKGQTKAETTILLFDTKKSGKIILAPVNTAKQLDELWEEYFRSKNPWAVKRIISALQLKKEASDFELMIVGSAAEWSLGSNAIQHPEVLSICKQALKHTMGATKEMLQGIIADAEKKK